MTETDIQILIDEYGVPEPKAEDYESSDLFWAAYNAWFDGFAAWVQRKVEAEEAARIAAEEEARHLAEEEEAANQAREDEVSVDLEQGTVSDPFNRYSVGTYIEEFPQVAEPYDPRSVGSYVDADGNLWTADGELLSPGTTPAMEPGVEELAAEIVGEPVTGEPVVDTALLLLDLLDALTGEEGMTSDVDGLQEAVGDIQQMLDHPLMTTSFQDYNVTEGLLLLLLLSVFIAACAKMLKGGFSWLR